MHVRVTKLAGISALLAALAASGCKKEEEADRAKKTASESEEKSGVQPAGGDEARRAPGAVKGFGDAAGTYKVDPEHSSVPVRIKHVDLAYVYGLFNDVKGTYKLADPPSESEVSLEVDAASIFTGVKKRDTHIKSPDMLNVKQYPKITFKSTKVEPIGDGTYRVTGDLELHGVTKPIEVEMKHIGSGKDPWGGFRTGFEGSFTIDRNDFGIEFGPEMIGPELHLTVAIAGVKQ